MSRNLSRWTSAGDPARDRLTRLVDQVFSDFGGQMGRSSEDVSDRVWSPAVDISETGDALLLRAELPGLKREDVEITLENNTLTIRGERKFEKSAEDENFLRVESSYGSFARSFTLPGNVQTDKTKAHFQDGVLEIRLPKMDEAKPRRIEIG